MKHVELLDSTPTVPSKVWAAKSLGVLFELMDMEKPEKVTVTEPPQDGQFTPPPAGFTPSN